MGLFSKSEETGNRLVQANDPATARRYCDNTISNTKYTWWNFVFKNLAEQFSRTMNRYFLLIACLQLIRAITPVDPMTTWGPLFVIFGVTAVKELIDDLGRGKQDKIANLRTYQVLKGTSFEQTRAKDIRVGDILRLKENEEFPCDLVLLSSADPTNVCYIQTTNLDGETNLKLRACLKETCNLKQNGNHLSNFSGVVECAAPNDAIYSFDSVLRISPDSQEKISLCEDQLLLQATNVRNVDWICGMAVYTGNETKFGKNKKIPPPKCTKIEYFINKCSLGIFCFQFLLVIIFGIAGNVWKEDNGRKMYYLEYKPEDDESWYQLLIIPARFLLLNSTMIPISLKVTIDLCKLYYSKFINLDEELRCPESGQLAHANSTALSEDLGQVQYILSDKTGTLTENRMVTRQLSIGGLMYNVASQAEPDVGPDSMTHRLKRSVSGRQWSTTPLQARIAAARGCPSFAGIGRVDTQEGLVLETLRCLALNNTVVAAPPAPGSAIPTFKAASPDEEALVKGAAEAGVILQRREGTRVELNVLGHTEVYDVLHEFPFNSDRKRMSVLVRDLNSHNMRLYVKGADEVVMCRMAATASDAKIKTQVQVDACAAIGLRTLVLGYRDVSEEDYRVWLQRFHVANTAMKNRDAEKEKCYSLLEQQLLPIGATAIEDKLQVGVPRTIANLRRSGIHLWMCTGDKFSTALTIAHSCNLKSNRPTSLLVEVEGSSPEEVGDLLRRAVKVVCCPILAHGVLQNFLTPQGAFKKTKEWTELCVIVRGVVAAVALAHHRELFLKLSLAAHTVICCRVTPKQKADLVKIVKDAGKLTLAVGDGGNDVSMIQEAHVGVGIRGKEGLQAARASDYQVSMFQHLERLLLVHGRYSYTRTSYVAQYSFYKSFYFCFMQIAFGFFSGYAGSSLFNSLCVAAYNAVLFPCVVLFCVDKDVSIDTVLRRPEIYSSATAGDNMNVSTFLKWWARALYQAAVTLLILFGTSGTGEGSDGFGSGGWDYQAVGLVGFMAYLMVQDFTMLLGLSRITMHNIVSVLGIHLFAVGTAYAMNTMLGFSSFIDYKSLNAVIVDPSLWLVTLLITAAAVLPVEYAKALAFSYFPDSLGKMKHMEIADRWGEGPASANGRRRLELEARGALSSPMARAASSRVLASRKCNLEMSFNEKTRSNSGMERSSSASPLLSDGISSVPRTYPGATALRRGTKVI